MEHIIQENPWLVIIAVAFVSFVLGRISVGETAQIIRSRQADRQAEIARFNGLEPRRQAEIRELLRHSGKIAAIRKYRELTNSGLKNSKKLIDSLVDDR
jgi:ribosomal protein L7/L12